MFFDGKVSSGRNVSLSGKKTKTDTKDLVERARKEREQREILKQKNVAAVVIQSKIRRFLTGIKYSRIFAQEFDKKVEDINKIRTVLKLQGVTFNVPTSILSTLLLYLNFILSKNNDSKRLFIMQQFLLDSLATQDFNYLSLCSSDLFRDVSSFRLLRFLQSTIILLSFNSLDATIQEASVTLLTRILLNDANSATLQSTLSLSLVDDAAYSLRNFIQSTPGFEFDLGDRVFVSVLVRIIKSALTGEKVATTKNFHKAINCLFLHLFTLSKTLVSYAALDPLIQVVVAMEISVAELTKNLFTPTNSISRYSLAARLQQNSNEKLNFLSNISLLLLRKRKNIGDTSSNDSILFQSDWIQLIEDVIFNFQVPNQKSSGYYPLASALRSFEYGPPSFPDVAVKMDVDNEDPKKLEEETSFLVSEATLTEFISDYILLEGGKKLELHNHFLIHSLQKKEFRQPLWNLSQLSDSVRPILQVLTNNDFVSNVIDSITPINFTEENHGIIRNMFSLLRIYTMILTNCSIDLPYSELSSSSSSATINLNSLTTRYSTLKFQLLNTLAFSHNQHDSSFVLRLWSLITGSLQNYINKFINYDETTFINDNEVKRFVESLQLTPIFFYQSIQSLLYLFGQTFYHQLSAVDDEEFLKSSSSPNDSMIQTISSALQQEKTIFPVSELSLLVGLLKQLMWKFYWNEPILDTNITTTFMHPKPSLLKYDVLMKYSTLTALTCLFNHICVRNERRSFLGVTDWQWLALQSGDFALVDPSSDAYAARERRYQGGEDSSHQNHLDLAAEGDFYVRNSNVKMVLFFIPQVIPFKQRVALFQSLVEYDKINYYHSLGSGMNPFAMGLGLQYNIRANIRRGDHLIEDAVKELNNVPGYKLKGKIQIEFISEQGYQEAGIDGGGIFKEFMDLFAKFTFDPSFGLFLSTSEQQLTINPNAQLALGEGYSNLYYFVGKMLGKALYEKLLFQSEFSLGFLNLLLGRVNEIDDLYHYDVQVYRSLMDLKRRAAKGEDISLLDLYFEVTRQFYGQVYNQELIPNGSKTKVTNHNVLQYIHRYAHYQQNLSVSNQCKALIRGFRELIPIPWIRMFNTRELQLLINGETRKIDLNDLKLNTNYSSGFHESQPYIQGFWEIIDNMSFDDQKNFLKFVTSCVRQPLLGFKELNPKFCIQKVSQYANIPLGSDHSNNPQTIGIVPRLPSAATCMNLLKLPQYDSIEILKEKLLYAIRSNSGFELS
eukprot:gene1984-2120_t